MYDVESHLMEAAKYLGLARVVASAAYPLSGIGDDIDCALSKVGDALYIVRFLDKKEADNGPKTE